MAITTGTLILGAGYATITYAVVGGIALYGLSSVFGNALGMGRPKMPRMGGGSGLSNNIDPVANFEIIYGETRKGGTKTYMELTNNDKYLHTIITLAGHEVNSIGDIYLDDEVVSFSGSDGTVTTSKWNSKVYIKKFTGASNQSVYSTLNSLTYKPTQINSNFKGQGIACLYVRLEYDRDTFPNGMPLVTAKIQGKKVYDPRKDSTSSAYDNSLGVSSHRTNNPSTWQYSDEPALAIRDYLTSNLGLDADQSDIDDDMIATAIADCASTGVVGVQNNAFKIGGVLDTGATPSGNLNTLMTTLNGTLFWGQGKWRLLAGAYKTPDASVSNANAFGYDDFRSDISIATRLSRRDTTNTVRGTFIDGSTDGRFIATDYPQQQIPDLSEDNDEVSILDLELPLTTNSATAQRLAKQVLFVSREQITFSADFSLEKAFGVQIGDTVEVTLDRYGWARKTFRVISWKMSGMDGSAPVVNMTLQETSATAYQWSVSSDEYQQITQNNTNLGDPTSNLAITGLATTLASSLQTDGTSMSRIILSWNAVSSPILRHYEVEWKPSSLSNYSSTIAPNNAIEIEPLTAGTTYNFRVRAVTVRENSGSYATINATAVTDTTAPSTPSAPTVTAGVKQLEVSWQGYSFPSDFASMEVHHSTSSGGTYSLIGTSAGTSLVHGGLTQNTTHYYKLKAKDFSGNISGFSAVGNGTVAADVQGPQGPAGQSGLIVTLNGSDIIVNNIDPRDNTSTVQAALNTAFLAANPMLSQMSDIPDDAVVWARFVNSADTEYAEGRAPTQFSARKWVYDDQDWTDNSGTFENPAIFSPLVIAEEAVVKYQSALEITARQLTIGQNINYLDGGGWQVGKTSYSDTSDGLWIGNPAGSSDFALATGANAGSANEHGILFDINQTKLINPTIMSGTGSLQTAVTVTSNISNVAISDSNGKLPSNTLLPVTGISIEAVGGGGGGKGAEYGANGSNGTSTSYVLTGRYLGASSATIISVTAAGGAGATAAASWYGSAGEDSAFAFGGAAANASFGDGYDGSKGSGGGGAGGRRPDTFTNSTVGGAGGSAGVHASDFVDLTGYTEVYLTITLGSGGAGGASARFSKFGGDGGDAEANYQIQTSSLEQVYLSPYSPIGVGQTWSDFGSGSGRSTNVHYRNTTDKPIMVNVGGANGLAGTAYVWNSQSSTPSGTTGSILVGGSGTANYYAAFTSIIVPVGGWYYLAGSSNLIWAELR